MMIVAFVRAGIRECNGADETCQVLGGPHMNDCQGQLPPHAKEGLRLFNAGEYFEAHEALESAWREETGEVRRLYQGILEAAVTYLHIQRGKYKGAVKVYGRGMKWLRDWPDVCCGVNVGKLRADLGAACPFCAKRRRPTEGAV